MKNGIIYFLSIICIGLSLYIFSIDRPANNVAKLPKIVKSDNQIMQPPNYAAINNSIMAEMPKITFKSGVQKVFSNREREAKFKIITPPGELLYYIKMIDPFTKKTYVTILLNSGQIFETKIALGTYILKYASGGYWFGEDKISNFATDFYEMNSDITFWKDKNTISGVEIRLAETENGNLTKTKIDYKNF